MQWRDLIKKWNVSLEFVESHVMRENLQYDSPEPALQFCSYLTCRWREREGSTAWGRTDGYCHTLQYHPERCAVKLLQESIDEGQLPVWKVCKRKLPFCHASVTDWLSVAAHVSLLHAKYCIYPGQHKWISICRDPIRLPHILKTELTSLSG